MDFSDRFLRRWWWGLLLFFTLCTVFVTTGHFKPGWRLPPTLAHTVIYVWLILLLTPLFSEISIFGIGVKRALRELREEVRRVGSFRRYWLGNDLATLRQLAVRSDLPGEVRTHLVGWQSKQALDHARAADLPSHVLEKLESAIRNVRTAPTPQVAALHAEELVRLQREIGGYLARYDENQA